MAIKIKADTWDEYYMSYMSEYKAVFQNYVPNDLNLQSLLYVIGKLVNITRSGCIGFDGY